MVIKRFLDDVEISEKELKKTLIENDIILNIINKVKLRMLEPQITDIVKVS